MLMFSEGFMDQIGCGIRINKKQGRLEIRFRNLAPGNKKMLLYINKNNIKELFYFNYKNQKLKYSGYVRIPILPLWVVVTKSFCERQTILARILIVKLISVFAHHFF